MANPNACRAAGVRTTKASICKSRKTDEWFWHTGTAGYDRRISLSGAEKTALASIASRTGGGWHQWARSSLSRLLEPLQDALIYVGSRDKVRQNVLRIVIVEMHRKQRHIGDGLSLNGQTSSARHGGNSLRNIRARRSAALF